MTKKKPNCKECQDIPLWGCVACPRPKTKAEKKAEELQNKLDEIEIEVTLALQTHENTIVKEARKRYNVLLKIRNIIKNKG